MAKTLYDKLWDAHFVTDIDGDGVLYIDRHLIHEVTSPQAFDGLKQKGRKVRRPDLTIATMDHSISTQSLSLDACGPKNALQLKTLVQNCNQHDIVLYPVGDSNQGIVHVMGPELGLIQPGMTVVCGRFTHRHPWRTWYPCFWYWYIRCRTRACYANYQAIKSKKYAGDIHRCPA